MSAEQIFTTELSDLSTRMDDPPKERPRNLKGVLIESQRLQEAGDLLGAANCLEEAVDLAPDNITVRIKAIKTLHAAGQNSRSRQVSAYFETCELDEAIWRRLVGLFISVKDITRAYLMTSRFLRTNPDHEIARLELIKLLIDSGRFNEAMEEMERLLGTPTLSSSALLTISRYQYKLKKFKEAAVTAARGVKLDGNSFDMLLVLARAMHNGHESRYIRPYVVTFEKLAGNDVKNWGWVAEVASWAKMKKVVDAAIRKILSFTEVPDMVWLNIARAQTSLGRYHLVRASLESINIAASEDLALLESLLQFLERLKSEEGTNRTCEEIASLSVRRIAQLSNPRKEKFDIF